MIENFDVFEIFNWNFVDFVPSNFSPLKKIRKKLILEKNPLEISMIDLKLIFVQFS